MKLLYTICYVSKADPNLTDSQIQEIFEKTEKKNTECKVSGILLHSLGNFFQVLEGEKEYLEKLYEDKILKDSRHTDVYEIYRKATAKPVFINYLSHFKVITTSAQLDEIREYLNHNKTISTSEKLTRLLAPFIIFD